MRSRSRKEGFTLVELLVVIAIIGILVALLLPAIQAAREAARRNQCVNNMKNIGLALQTHHDVYNRLPLASSRILTSTPGASGATGAGYSWIVALLPYIEEGPLWDRVVAASGNFKDTTTHPFGQKFTVSATGANAGTAAGYHISTVSLSIMMCPSFGGDNQVNTKGGTVGPYKDARSGTSEADGPKYPAVGNYKACAQSYLGTTFGIPAIYQSGNTTGNGALVFPLAASATGEIPNRGLGLKSITDGTSKTVVVSESKEKWLTAWYDGQTQWVAAAWPGSAPGPSATTTGGDGFMGWGPSTITSPDVQTSLNIGIATSDADPATAPPTGQRVYMAPGTFPGVTGIGCTWGPSSDHTGGAVNHAWADGHVTAIVSTNIDKNLYLRIYSRNGGEPVNIEN